jgi:hypothetical protein
MELDKNMSISIFYRELKAEFDRIQQSISQKKRQKFHDLKPVVSRGLSGDEMQAIKDEVASEETHSWSLPKQYYLRCK